MTNDNPSYIPINVEFSDVSSEQHKSETSISDYEEIIVEDVDISQCIPYKVHKTTMDPEFLVITNGSSTQEDHNVDLLPFSTRLTPLVADHVILAQDNQAPSQSELTRSIQNDVSVDAVNDNTTADPFV
ncbi:hypothetical protein L1987_23255 [Smallanthus sonchifolius]|uniref:Uncharacterized protein n=1 Tax=Smallanthus sonchifolius TaxID=185202 RepID=A0ACB9IH57_9ASTR|nr:hypothetical protein L1987_23255 [Smallanthus sonchifolius]